ncbi:MAG TPA: hypothetical protein VFQ38_06940 [Longimicrobiales bacterium]|nr:hypothetical protein [Longimicrobiales bacterium]
MTSMRMGAATGWRGERWARRRAAVAALAALLALPGALSAWQCELVEGRAAYWTEGERRGTVAIAGPLELRCAGGASARADSALYDADTRALRLFGRVSYEDGEASVTAASLELAPGQIVARGDVVYRGRASGVTLRAPVVAHTAAAAGRSARTVVPARGTATLPAAGSAPALSLSADAMAVADGRLRARGSVRAEAGELRASSDSAEVEPGAGGLVLAGRPRLEAPRASLSATTIALRRSADATAVRARGAARLVGAAFRLSAPALDIVVPAGPGAARAIATRAEERRGAGGAAARARPERPRLVAGEHWLEADSIETSVQGEVAREVVAVGGVDAGVSSDSAGPRIHAPSLRIALLEGGGFGGLAAGAGAARVPPGAVPGEAAVRVTSRDGELRGDSVALRPEGGGWEAVAVKRAELRLAADSSVASLPAELRARWVRADTLWVQAADGAGAAPIVDALARRLSSLRASGGAAPASLLYSMAASGERRGGTYLSARRIRLAFSGGRVVEVQADGDVRGLLLRAAPAAAPSGRRPGAPPRRRRRRPVRSRPPRARAAAARPRVGAAPGRMA